MSAEAGLLAKLAYGDILPTLPERGYQAIGLSVDPVCQVFIEESNKHPGYFDLLMFTTRESVSTRRPVQNSKLGRAIASHWIINEIGDVSFNWRIEPIPESVDAINLSPVVYFISDEDGYIKIGTSTHPSARLADLQAGSRQELHIVATIPGGHTEESALHRRFSDSRVRGEWFRPTDALIEFMEGILE